MERLWARLRRRTTSGAFIPEIDGLRFLAITSVFLVHLADELAGRLGVKGTPQTALVDRFAGRGSWGVELFFVLSGLLLAWPFVAHRLRGAPRPSLKRYFLRRLTRLEPPYLVALVLAFPIIVLTTAYTTRQLVVPFVAGAFYQYGVVGRGPNPLNPVLWSLEIEVQFYVVMPLLALAFLVRRAWARRALLLAAIALCLAQPWSWRLHAPGSALVLHTLPTYLAFFLVGLLLADLLVTRAPDAPARGSALADVAFVVAMFVPPFLSEDVAGLVLPAVFGVMVWAAFRGRLVRRVLSWPVLTTIGGMCYSIYLLHDLALGWILHRTLHLTSGLPFTAQFLAQLALAGVPVLLACGAFYALVERPCMDPSWPRKLARRVRRSTGGAGAPEGASGET